MLELQKFLVGGGTIKGLAEKYAIKHKRHGIYPNLVLFKYSQIDSPMGEKIVQEARGIILDEDDGWRVVARGFDKFFNHLESNAAAIDWTTARVQEKVDGSLCMLYPYDRSWFVATTGSPDASGEVDTAGFTFADLFWYTLDSIEDKDYRHQWSGVWDDGICFLFELTSPHNRIVVRHEKSYLTLLAVRDNENDEWVDVNHLRSAWSLDFPLTPRVKEYPLTSFEEVLQSFDAIKGIEQEGYVVVDGQGNRVKVKHPQYVALHHLKESVTPKALANIVVTNESSELLTVFPEYQVEIDRVKVIYDTMVLNIEKDYAASAGIEGQKEFALAIKHLPVAPILFALRAGKAASVKEWFADERNFTGALRFLGIKE